MPRRKPLTRRSAPRAIKAPRAPGWTCPACGRRFVQKVAEHTCGRFSLATHFAGRAPHVRALFDRIAALIRACGPAEITPLKTTITFSAPVIFGGATTRREALHVTLFLPGNAEHRTCVRRRQATTVKVGHAFVLREVADLDDDFAQLVREAYAEARASRG